MRQGTELKGRDKDCPEPKTATTEYYGLVFSLVVNFSMIELTP